VGILVSDLASQNIVLLGLPGSGKSKVAQSLVQQFNCNLLSEVGESHNLNEPEGCVEWQDFLQLPSKNLKSNQQFWCVIDVRSTLDSHMNVHASWLETELKKILAISDGIVFSFVEAASLDEQAWWSQWLAKNITIKKPIARWMNQQFASGFTGFETQETKQDKSDTVNVGPSSEEIESYHFSVKRIVLEHLLMGLDNSKQNLAMKIMRVTGRVDTFEYENLVDIEGSAYRWDTFAATSDKEVGQIVVSGVGLDQAWLSQIINAAQQ